MRRRRRRCRLLLIRATLLPRARLSAAKLDYLLGGRGARFLAVGARAFCRLSYTVAPRLIRRSDSAALPRRRRRIGADVRAAAAA